MFLALKEILFHKSRYRLVISVVFLVTYMIFFLSSLSNGLARSNRLVLENWQAKSVVLSEYANNNLTASTIKQADYRDWLSDNIVEVGQLSVVINKPDGTKINTNIFGVDFSQFVAPTIIEGRAATAAQELVIDKAMTNNQLQLGDQVQINGSDTLYTIVGFTENNRFFTQPAIFMSLSDFRTLKYGSADNLNSSLLVIRDDTQLAIEGLKQISIPTLIQAIPGYQAQLMTFNFMIGAMVAITFLVLAIFMYILTLQKTSLYGIMRAQGISTKAIVSSIFYQIGLLVAVGTGLALIAIFATQFILPARLPFYSSWQGYSILTGTILITSLFGGLLSIRKVIAIDPINAIGGE